jgi:hypothetical protein
MEDNFILLYNEVYKNIENIKDQKIIYMLENNILLNKIKKENPNYDEKIIKSIGLTLLLLLNSEINNNI